MFVTRTMYECRWGVWRYCDSVCSHPDETMLELALLHHQRISSTWSVQRTQCLPVTRCYGTHLHIWHNNLDSKHARPASSEHKHQNDFFTSCYYLNFLLHTSASLRNVSTLTWFSQAPVYCENARHSSLFVFDFSIWQKKRVLDYHKVFLTLFLCCVCGREYLVKMSNLKHICRGWTKWNAKLLCLLGFPKKANRLRKLNILFQIKHQLTVVKIHWNLHSNYIRSEIVIRCFTIW